MPIDPLGRPDLVVPDGFGAKLAPPKKAQEMIVKIGERTVCGGHATIVWPLSVGAKAGMPVTLWCVEPLCVTTGQCTGSRFVPHEQQYTIADPDDPSRKLRSGLPRSHGGRIPNVVLFNGKEAVAAVKEAARLKQKDGALPDRRSDSEIREFVRTVWKRMRKAVNSGGSRWSPG